MYGQQLQKIVCMRVTEMKIEQGFHSGNVR